MAGAQGGIEAGRGMLFQAYSLLYYSLLRRLHYPEVSITFESVEDASLVYPLVVGSKAIQIVELVQCKKREAREMNLRSGEEDSWERGRFGPSDLLDWIKSSSQLLTSDEHHYYTGLYFGRLNNQLTGFAPKPLSGSPSVSWSSPSFNFRFPADHKHLNDWEQR